MKVEIVAPEREWRVFAALEVDDRYMIELSDTLFAGIRVTLRKNNDYGLLCNWCAGVPDREFHSLLLVNCMLDLILRDEEDVAPFCSNIKPYYNDPEFSGYVFQNMQMHIMDWPQFFEVGKVFMIGVPEPQKT